LALSAKQTAEVTHALDALEQRLRDEMRQAAPQAATENFRELAGEVHDAGEESVAVTVEDTRRSLQGRQLRELREIDAARQRLAHGSFGVCVECGQEIPYPRLLAYPVAQRCVVCQSQHERIYTGERAPTL
jgi:DnaK suppressor protein